MFLLVVNSGPYCCLIDVFATFKGAYASISKNEETYPDLNYTIFYGQNFDYDSINCSFDFIKGRHSNI